MNSSKFSIIDNYFNKDQCLFLIDRYCGYNPFINTRGGLEYNWGVDSIKDFHETDNLITSFVSDMENKMINSYADCEIEFDRIFIQTYKKNTYLEEHLDGETKFAVLAYLNDDYEGGELEFTKDNIKIKPKLGDVIYFHGGEQNPHKVHKIQNGKRVTLVLFFKKKGTSVQYNLIGEKI